MVLLTSKLSGASTELPSRIIQKKYGKAMEEASCYTAGIDAVIVDHQNFTHRRLSMHRGKKAKHRGYGAGRHGGGF
jgi:hypothetical protein